MKQWSKSLNVSYKGKGNSDPVSDADIQSHTFLTSQITARYPDHNILSEENLNSKSIDSDFLWVIDPLDGTINYINKYPCFGVSIGILFQGVPVVGAIFVKSPENCWGQILHARIGGGAFINESPVKIPKTSSLCEGKLLGLPQSFQSQYEIEPSLERKFSNTRVTGSIVYELAQVALGIFQCAVFNQAKIWDIAGSCVIISEADGSMFVQSKRSTEWYSFESFLQPDRGLPKNSDIKKWSASILVGNSELLYSLKKQIKKRRRKI
jgi:myo-inositol-1(or 4)-monophosphatase